MRWTGRSTLLGIFGLMAVAVQAQTVRELFSSNFDHSIEQHDGAVLVEFYAPWCGHCKQFAPTLAELAAQHPDVLVGKIDATVEKALAARFHVKGYPSIYHITPGRRQVRRYESNRGLEEVSHYLKGAYQNQDAIPWMASPFGPAGMLKGACIRIGTRVLGFHRQLADQGYSELGASIIIMGAAIGALITIVVLLAWLTAPSSSPYHAHQD